MGLFRKDGLSVVCSKLLVESDINEAMTEGSENVVLRITAKRPNDGL